MRGFNLLGVGGALLILGLGFALDLDWMAGGPEIPTEALTGPEALQWLEANRNESALASNRFGETHHAIAFVKSLYAQGAKGVYIWQESITDDPETLEFEGGPYADALVVEMPEPGEVRNRLARTCHEELAREGFDSSEVDSSPRILLWWE